MIAIERLRRELDLPLEKEADLADIRQAVIDAWERETVALYNRRASWVQEFLNDVESGLPPTILSLELAPVEAVTLVEVKDMTASAWTTLLATDWYLKQDKVRGKFAHLHRVNGCWPALVRVTYSGGFTEAPSVGQYKTPSDIAEAMYTQAKFLRYRNSPEKVTVNNQAFQGGGGSYHAPDMHPLFKQVVERYRRVC